MTFAASTVEVDTVLTLLECPVCLLPPRVPPIYQCRTGERLRDAFITILLPTLM